MQPGRFTAHAVHLFHGGRYLRTLPDSFSPAQAQQFVTVYNRKALGTGDFAIATASDVIAHLPPTGGNPK